MGVCTGCGLDTVDGQLEVIGPRSARYPDDLAIGDRNGLHCDPDTGQLWVQPPSGISVVTDSTTEKQFNPAGYGQGVIVLLDQLQVEFTAGDQPVLVQRHIAGGFASMRMASGNFWVMRRRYDLWVDEVGVATTGMEDLFSTENNSGGVLTNGAVGDSDFTAGTLNPGQKARYRASYEFEAMTLTPNALNVFTWQAPGMHLIALTTPNPEGT